jgi:uncharacterized tellurite resistance protein B-like protein
MKSFFIKRSYEPENEQEAQELEEFSLISAAMQLMIYVAMANGTVSDKEKKIIIEELLFQLSQRPFEYESLVEEFGDYEHNLIELMFDKILTEYKELMIDYQDLFDTINMIYESNPQKRLYLLRICFSLALSDNQVNVPELKVVEDIATHLNISEEDMKRIKKEVLQTLK